MAVNKNQPQQKTTAPAKAQPVTKKTAVAAPFIFNKDNYLWMVIGGVIVLIGMLIMSGGKSDNPNVFDPHVVYSTTRITIAPFLIIGGLMVEIYAIFRKSPKKDINV